MNRQTCSLRKQDSNGSTSSRNKSRKAALVVLPGRSSIINDVQGRFAEMAAEQKRKQASLTNQVKSLENMKKQFQENVKKSHELDYEIKQIHPEIESNIQKQIEYYYNLLDEGTDTRNHGLSWIVKTIHYLEQKLPAPIKFPKFLEEETVTLILKIAAWDLQKEKVEQALKKKNSEKYTKNGSPKNVKTRSITTFENSLSLPNIVFFIIKFEQKRILVELKCIV